MMDTEPTRIFVRVRGEDGGWDNVDIALLSAMQQKEFSSTVDEEKAYAWFPTMLQELCKIQQQNAELLAALKEMINPPTIMEHDHPFDIASWFVEKARQAIAKAGE